MKENQRPTRRELLITRDGDQCWWCGLEFRKGDDKRRTIDHVVPTAKGGTNHPRNTVLCCRECNRAKGDDHPLVWLARIFAHAGWPGSKPPSSARIEKLRARGLDSCGAPLKEGDRNG